MQYGQALSQWVDGRPERTVVEYRRDVGQAFKFFGHERLQLTLDECQAYRAHLVDVRKLAPRGVRKKLTILRGFLTFCRDEGYCDRNPMQRVQMPTPDEELNLAGRILSPEQVRLLITSAPMARDRLFLALAYATGARVSELCGLTWADCTEKPDGGAQLSVLGKRNKRRQVNISASLWREFNPLRQRPGTAVFGMDRFQAARMIRETAERAKLPGWVTMHKLRHAHISHALDNGAPIHLVRDTVGHVSLATTGIYAKSNPKESSSSYVQL
ncbi:MAG: tyrosine-type recombinase/integrase [Cyanobacteria bacterium J06626_23]